jgi:hypothetical protein
MERLVYVDSLNRDTKLYPNGNSYTLYLTDVIKNVSRVDLVAAQVPNTLFNLTNGSGVVTYGNLNLTTGTPLTTVSLDPGFYSGYTIQAQLTNSSNAVIGYQYMNDEGRFLLFAGSQFTVTFNTAEIANIVGFNPGQTYTSQPASTFPVFQNDPRYTNYFLYVSPNVVNFTVADFVFLDVTELRTPTMIDAQMRVGNTYNGSSARGSFAMIPMDVNSGSIKNFKENTDFRISVYYPEPINSIERLTINWYDRTGTMLNFMGFNNNAFLLRFTLAEKPEFPPPPDTQEVEVKRIIDAMTFIPPPAPKKKNHALGRWFIYFLLFAVTLWGYHWYRRAQAPPIELPRT